MAKNKDLFTYKMHLEEYGEINIHNKNTYHRKHTQAKYTNKDSQTINTTQRKIYD